MFLPHFFLQPVSSLPISFFRIFFALFMLYRTWKTWDIHLYFKLHTFNFSYLRGLKPFKGLQYLNYLRVVAFVGLLLGLEGFASLSFVLFFHLFFLDKALYFDSIYLQGLFLFLLALTDSNASLSVVESTVSQVPYWQIFVFQFQIAIVFFYKAVSKLHYDWLFRQEPLRDFLWFFANQSSNRLQVYRRYTGKHFAALIHSLFNHQLFAKCLAYFLPIIELLICPLIFYPPSYSLGIVLYFAYCIVYDLFSGQSFFCYENYLYGLFLIRPDFLGRVFELFGGVL